MDLRKIRLEEIRNKKIPIGKVAENKRTSIGFDCSSLFAEYPDALPALTVISPTGVSYPAIVERQGDLVLWEIRDSDLTASGTGEIQLAFIQGEVVARSYTGRTEVIRSISSTGEAPDPIETWETEAGAMLAEVEQALEDIPQAIDTALEAAKESGEFKGDKGDPGEDGKDGYTPIKGVDYFDGQDGVDGKDGENGSDGVSPAVSVTDIQGGHRVVITDKDHPQGQTFDVMDGQTQTVPVQDVQIDGESILDDGAANIPRMTSSVFGVAKVGDGLGMSGSGAVRINSATDAQLKSGSDLYRSVVPGRQHISAFYALAKLAGVDLANETVTMGQYPDAAKVAIREMLEPKYRKIIEITISGNDTKTLQINTDQYDEPFALRDVVIDFAMTIASGTSNCMIVPNISADLPGSADFVPYLAVQNLFNANYSQRRIARLHVSGGRLFGDCEYTSMDNHYTSYYTQRNRNATGILECEPITKLRIWSINGHYYGNGTKITIYGR